MVQVGVVEERFGRNAANVQACTTECAALLDTCCLRKLVTGLLRYVGTNLKAFLAGLDGTDIASNTTSYEEDIVLGSFRSVSSPLV